MTSRSGENCGKVAGFLANLVSLSRNFRPQEDDA